MPNVIGLINYSNEQNKTSRAEIKLKSLWLVKRIICKVFMFLINFIFNKVGILRRYQWMRSSIDQSMVVQRWHRQRSLRKLNTSQ